MRVLHVISGLGTGGAETFLATLAPRLEQRGIDQTVVSLTGDGPLAERFEASDIAVKRLNARGPRSAIKAVGELRRILARQQPHIVQGWMYHGDLFAALAHRTTKPGTRRLFWNIRCSDMRLEDYARQLRMVVRGCIWASRMPDVVLANSAAGAEVHLAAGYRPRQLEIIPNGIDCNRYAPKTDERRAVRAELGVADDTAVIMHVARVDPMKDHMGLLAAAEQLRGAKVVLIGTGTERLAGPANVTGLGQRRDVARLLCGGDIIVSSSAYGEGFSNAVAEGMASGLVPVTTRVGDADDIVGNAGTIVAPRDPAALATALQAMIDLDPADRTRRGLAARERIVALYSLERAVERFEALYRSHAA